MLAAANFAAAAALVAFMAAYATVRWERSEEGRHIMGSSLAVGILVASGLVRRLDPDIGDGLATFAYFAVAVVIGAQLWMLGRAQGWWGRRD